MANNIYPGIDLNYENNNPILSTPNEPFSIQFAQSKESLECDAELYSDFLNNAISRFRHSKTYKQYKSHLYEAGLDRCQVLGNITEEMVGQRGIEMHHNFLTIHDIALMISKHVLNTTGYITTFDLVQLLKEEHKANRIPLIMLSKSVHQMYHANQEFVLPADMSVGKWYELLEKYKYGITLDIAYKVIYFLNKSIELDQDKSKFPDDQLLNLREQIKSWSEYNEYIDIKR